VGGRRTATQFCFLWAVWGICDPCTAPLGAELLVHLVPYRDPAVWSCGSRLRSLIPRQCFQRHLKAGPPVPPIRALCSCGSGFRQLLQGHPRGRQVGESRAGMGSAVGRPLLSHGSGITKPGSSHLRRAICPLLYRAQQRPVYRYAPGEHPWRPEHPWPPPAVAPSRCFLARVLLLPGRITSVLRLLRPPRAPGLCKRPVV
jgi:hypothetical protein